MIHSALVLVPHQDDDLNVAGCLIDQMIAADVSVYVCFATNGDYDGMEQIRAKEVQAVAKLLHYKKVLYLGYGDGGIQQESLYFADEQTVLSSHAGYTETHGVFPFTDFHYEKYGCHALYTKANVRRDIKDAVLSVRADLILCIDNDSHPDHKLVSCLFDEVLQKIIAETDYRPLVLKKFAYLGTWHGRNDYFVRKANETECIDLKSGETSNACLPHKWETRLRFAVTGNMLTPLFWNSILFKAYRKYKSQSGAAFFARCCNADAVYWYFDTTKNRWGTAKDFPINETPFTFYDVASTAKRIFFVLFVCRYIYAAYIFAFYRLPGKIKLVLHGGRVC